MSSISSILYDMRTKEFFVCVRDRTGVAMHADQRFKTKAEAEEFVAKTLQRMA